MTMIEFREDVLTEAFSELKKAKKHNKKTKLALCELEDLLYQCYENEADNSEDDEYDETENYDEESYYDEEPEVKFRRRRSMRMGNDSTGMSGMRSHNAMRRNRRGRYVY